MAVTEKRRTCCDCSCGLLLFAKFDNLVVVAERMVGRKAFWVAGVLMRRAWKALTSADGAFGLMAVGLGGRWESACVCCSRPAPKRSLRTTDSMSLNVGSSLRGTRSAKTKNGAKILCWIEGYAFKKHKTHGPSVTFRRA